jgi:fatty acid desaturase
VNAEGDFSGTMPYQRDSFKHFLMYWFKFVTCTLLYIPYFSWSIGNVVCAVNGMLSVGIYILTMFMLCKVNFAVTMYVFVVPYFVVSLALSFGNWSQHIFLDPTQPETGYGCTYNCINHFENQLTFNDGYHIVHHLVSRLHWSEMPGHFMRNIEKYAKQDALCFKNLHFFEVGVLVHTGQWEKLADNVVQWGALGGVQRNQEETIAMLKLRCQPLHGTKNNFSKKKKKAN